MNTRKLFGLIAAGLLGSAALVISFYAGARCSKTITVEKRIVVEKVVNKPVPPADPDCRVELNPDGTRAVWLRHADRSVLNKYDFSSDGSLEARSVYRIAGNGSPLGCRVYDDRKTELYKVSYGYRKSNGELVEERVFDSKAVGKVVGKEADRALRRILYPHDKSGKRMEPVVLDPDVPAAGPKEKLKGLPSAFFGDPFAAR